MNGDQFEPDEPEPAATDTGSGELNERARPCATPGAERSEATDRLDGDRRTISHGHLVDDPPDEGSGRTEDETERVRRRLVRHFEHWLDRMLDGEPPPAGLPPELLAQLQIARDDPDAAPDGDLQGRDLYTLFSSLMTLTGEIRLQGRAFKQLADGLAPLAGVAARLDRVQSMQLETLEQLEQLSEASSQSEAALPSAEDVLAVVFDLHDRLERGLRTFDAAVESLRSGAAATRAGWRQRLLGGTVSATDKLTAVAAATREGYRLTLSRLEAALHEWGIRRTGAPGEPFDPLRMAAVDVGPAGGAEDGTVLEVYRSGYTLAGRVLATAQVKVARRGTNG